MDIFLNIFYNKGRKISFDCMIMHCEKPKAAGRPAAFGRGKKFPKGIICSAGRQTLRFYFVQSCRPSKGRL